MEFSVLNATDDVVSRMELLHAQLNSGQPFMELRGAPVAASADASDIQVLHTLKLCVHGIFYQKTLSHVDCFLRPNVLNHKKCPVEFRQSFAKSSMSRSCAAISFVSRLFRSEQLCRSSATQIRTRISHLYLEQLHQKNLFFMA